MKVMLKNVRLSYPSLFKPSGYQGSEPKYSATFLMEDGSEQHKALKAAILSVAEEQFADKAKAVLKKQDDNSMRRLLKHGNDNVDDEGEVRDGYADMVTIKASNKTAVRVIGRGKQDLTEADGIPYAGCYVNAQIDLWAQDNAYGKFINAKLLAVQFWADGDAFGAVTTANLDDFESAEDDDDGDEW